MQSASLLIFMKISLLLLTAFAAIPVYAGNLKYDDWSVDTNWGGNYAVDEDGILRVGTITQRAAGEPKSEASPHGEAA